MSFPGIIPRLELHYDKNNLLAREQYEKLKVFQCQDGEAPDLIVPIGGDGYMMHCIRTSWQRFIPFYGVNAGHVGYLLNDCATLEELFAYPLKLHTANMLYCQAEKETETGERVLLSELAFNDAWVERSSGQTALIRILVNGEERIRRLRGDGVLVSTAAGSTAYSQALGASPVPVGAPLIQVVGSNVVAPAQWRPVHLDQEDQVEFEVIDNIKRPCRCFVDSVNVGNVTRMLVRSSRVAGVTLAFSRSCDLQHKLYQMQFPKAM
uniref:NAD+ kinase n=1 Tax=Herpetomonas muscarum TaxID=5718 RepID=T1YUS8_HERMU|nr:NAD+ kinase [Herpetomonas muscarum]